MLQITPRHIETYSRCPRRAFNGWNYPQEPLSFHASVVRDVIQSSYVFYTRYHKPPSWKRFLAWIDKYVKKEMDDLRPKEVYQTSHKMLVTLDKWYEKYFCGDFNSYGLTNVPISLQLNHRVMYVDRVPLILFGDTIRVCDFSETKQTKKVTKIGTYNNFSNHIRAWGASQMFNLKNVNFCSITIAEQSIVPVELKLTETMLDKTRKIVDHIADGMYKGIWYPSFSQQCLSCPFADDCII